MSRIAVPMTIFIADAALLYFSLLLIFWTKPMDVPATITSALCPMEYSSISRIPQSRFSSPAMIASRAIKTGVEQGEEKMPPRIPAINAPANGAVN